MKQTINEIVEEEKILDTESDFEKRERRENKKFLEDFRE
jgi:hypothetical protein